LPVLYKSVGMDTAKDLIDRVINITWLDLARTQEA